MDRYIIRYRCHKCGIECECWSGSLHARRGLCNGCLDIALHAEARQRKAMLRQAFEAGFVPRD